MSNIQKSFQLMALGLLALALGISTAQATNAERKQCRDLCIQKSQNPGYDSCKKRLDCFEGFPVEHNPCKQQCNKENPNPAYFDCLKKCGFPIPEKIISPSKPR